MDQRERPCSIRRQISVQRVGSETLLYDERRHKAFCLNASSAAVWNLADGQRTVAEIGAAASCELGIEVGEDLVRFGLEELCRDGLVEADGLVEKIAAGPSISRRAVLQTLGVGGAMLLPVVVAIMAPTAAEAQSGCFDCTGDDSQKEAQAARARRLQQQLNNAQPETSPTPGTPQK